MFFFKNSQYLLTRHRSDFPVGLDTSTTDCVIRTNLPFSAKHITFLGKIEVCGDPDNFCYVSSPEPSSTICSREYSNIYEFEVHFVDGSHIPQSFTSYRQAEEMRRSIIDCSE